MADLLYELTLAAFSGRANGWFCGVSRRRMWAVSGDDFGDRVRGWLLSGTRWAGSGCAVRRGKWKKGSSDAEGAIGWTKNRKHGRMSDEIRAWGWGVKRPCASVVPWDCGSSGRCRVDNGRRTAASDGKVVVFG